jgi:rhodanese-related sulfurtransferase
MPQATYRRARGWAATIVALAAIAMAAVVTVNAGATQTPIVGARQAHVAAARGEVTIVDIRRPSEWRATGVPQGAALISLQTPRGARGFLERMAELTGGDKGKPLALICAGGVRSSYAAGVLRADGYTNVVDIGEGMLGSAHGPGWLQRRLPTEPCGPCVRQ